MEIKTTNEIFIEYIDWLKNEDYSLEKVVSLGKRWVAVEDMKKVIERLECKGRTHNYRPKWIDAEELLQQLSTNKEVKG